MAAADDTNGGVDVNGLDGVATRAVIMSRSIGGAACMEGAARERYALISSMVIEATGVRSDQFGTVILVGLGSGTNAGGDAIAVGSVANALAYAKARTKSTIVFVATPLDESALGPLIALAEESAAGSLPHLLVVVGWPDGRVPLRLNAGSLRGSSGFRAIERLAAARANSLMKRSPPASLVYDPHSNRNGMDNASSDPGTPPVVARPRQSEAPARRARTPARQSATTVSVEVLGPIHISGVGSAFECRPKLTELVVYLALHREGATTEAWSTALWPERRPPASTLSNRLSEARNTLGYASDGSSHVRKRGIRHLLSEEVTTDWDRFEALAAREGDADAWHRAISLVRGRPFDGLRAAQWTILEGIVPAMEAAVVEVACRLAALSLDGGDPYSADWAARRAMRACPWDERLYRIVMRSADAAGNRAGVKAALRQLAMVLEADPRDALGVVHAETAALYRELVSPEHVRRAN
jgi:DNA-binding SARP family transcriptional activator